MLYYVYLEVVYVLVYRVCSKNEVALILNSTSFDNIGTKEIFGKFDGRQSFRNELHIHFFPSIDNILYMIDGDHKYLCIYDLPLDILEKYKGYGDYCYNGHYKYNVLEYAVPSREMSFSYLKSIYVLLRDIDEYDFYYNQMVASAAEKIYDKSGVMMRQRKKEECSS